MGDISAPPSRSYASPCGECGKVSASCLSCYRRLSIAACGDVLQALQSGSTQYSSIRRAVGPTCGLYATRRHAPPYDVLHSSTNVAYTSARIEHYSQGLDKYASGNPHSRDAPTVPGTIILSNPFAQSRPIHAYLRTHAPPTFCEPCLAKLCLKTLLRD
jgi:hypothetical protein